MDERERIPSGIGDEIEQEGCMKIWILLFAICILAILIWISTPLELAAIGCLVVIAAVTYKAWQVGKKAEADMEHILKEVLAENESNNRY
jgi:ABC-type bacteriocin/lantibiotic exporter with double-glycine peptidase domain